MLPCSLLKLRPCHVGPLLVVLAVLFHAKLLLDRVDAFVAVVFLACASGGSATGGGGGGARFVLVEHGLAFVEDGVHFWVEGKWWGL